VHRRVSAMMADVLNRRSVTTTTAVERSLSSVLWDVHSVQCIVVSARWWL